MIVPSDMKTSYGANDEELLLPVDAEAGQYGHEESSLMRSPELKGKVQSTRYVKFLTFIVVVAALLGSTMYLSSSTRGNLSRRLSMDSSNSDATKLVNIGPNTTIKDIIDQLLWGSSSNSHPSNSYPTHAPSQLIVPSPTQSPEQAHCPLYKGTKTTNSTVILFNQLYDHLYHYLLTMNTFPSIVVYFGYSRF
jgi:hypothetical protein